MPYRIVEKSTGKIVAQDIINWREAEQKARPKALYQVELQTSPARESGQRLSLREQAQPLGNDPAEVAATLREAFKDLGLSEAAAAHAVQGRERPDDTLEDSFLRMGLGESAAKIAAQGR